MQMERRRRSIRHKSPAELLNRYVRQERSKHLQKIRKRAGGRCLSDFSIAALAIGVGSYGMMIPKYAMGGFTLAMDRYRFFIQRRREFLATVESEKTLRLKPDDRTVVTHF